MRSAISSWYYEHRAFSWLLVIALMAVQGCAWWTPTPASVFRQEFAPPILTVQPLSVPCDVTAPRTVPFEGQHRCTVLLEVDYQQIVTRAKAQCLAAGGGQACQATEAP